MPELVTPEQLHRDMSAAFLVVAHRIEENGGSEVRVGDGLSARYSDAYYVDGRVGDMALRASDYSAVWVEHGHGGRITKDDQLTLLEQGNAWFDLELIGGDGIRGDYAYSVLRPSTLRRVADFMLGYIVRDLGDDFDRERPVVHTTLQGGEHVSKVVPVPGEDPMLLAAYERIATILE